MQERSTSEKVIGILLGVLYIVLSGIMFMAPQTTLLAISLGIGWAMIIGGLALVIGSFTLPREFVIRNKILIDGIVIGLLGFIFIFGDFISNTKILAYFLIFWVIIETVMQLQFASYIQTMWVRVLTIVLDVFVLIYSISMLFQPAAAEGFLVFVVAVSFSVAGVSKIIRSF